MVEVRRQCRFMDSAPANRRLAILMNTSDHPKLPVSWALVAWLLLILSGALMTSLLRAPLVLSIAMPMVALSHLVGGAAIALLAVGQVIATGRPARLWRAILIAATPLCGWLAHRSFSPLTTAIHAALA